MKEDDFSNEPTPDSGEFRQDDIAGDQKSSPAEDQQSEYQPESAYRTLQSLSQQNTANQSSQPFQTWQNTAQPGQSEQTQQQMPVTQPMMQGSSPMQSAAQSPQPQQTPSYQTQDYPTGPSQTQNPGQSYQLNQYPQYPGQPNQPMTQPQYQTYQNQYPQQQAWQQPQSYQYQRPIYTQPQQYQYQQPQYPQPQYQLPRYGQPQYMQPMPQQYGYPRPAANGFWYQPDPARQAALSRWLGNVRKRFSTIGFTLTMVILVWNVLALAISQVVSMVVDPKNLPMWAELLMSNGPLYVVAIPLSLLIFRTVPKVKRKTSNMSVGMFLTLMAISFPISYIGSWIGSFLSALFSAGHAQSSIDKVIQGLDPLSLILLTVIIGPIFEEWLFRRLLIDRVQQYGEKTAILVSAFAFGLFHGNFFQFFYAFGFGLLLAYVYVRTGKLRYTIAMHMTFNFFGGFLPEAIYLPMSKSTMKAVTSGSSAAYRNVFASGHGAELIPLLAYELFIVVILIVGIVLAIINRKKLVFFTAPEELPRGVRIKTVLGNPGAITFVVICALLMIAALFNV